MNIRNGGFTLIEVLVVVLIIGILAAVAVPQYQKAVEKSRTTQAFAVLRTIAQAQQFYYLANGRYATKFEELDVDIPWSGRTKLHAPATDTRSNEDWSIDIDNSYAWQSIMIHRARGTYRGGGFAIYLTNPSSWPINELICLEQTGRILSAGAYCTKLWGGTYFDTVGDHRAYKLP